MYQIPELKTISGVNLHQSIRNQYLELIACEDSDNCPILSVRPDAGHDPLTDDYSIDLVCQDDGAVRAINVSGNADCTVSSSDNITYKIDCCRDSSYTFFNDFIRVCSDVTIKVTHNLDGHESNTISFNNDCRNPPA